MSGKLEVENYSLTTSSHYVFHFVASCEKLSFREWMELWISKCCEFLGAVNSPRMRQASSATGCRQAVRTPGAKV